MHHTPASGRNQCSVHRWAGTAAQEGQAQQRKRAARTAAWSSTCTDIAGYKVPTQKDRACKAHRGVVEQRAAVAAVGDHGQLDSWAQRLEEGAQIVVCNDIPEG